MVRGSTADYDQHLDDFGFPVTNWEVVVALTEIYNVTPNLAQNELLSVFTGERWADALTNNPGLTLNGFATGETPLDATGSGVGASVCDDPG